MKKLLCIILTAVVVFSLCACSKEYSGTKERVSQNTNSVDNILSSAALENNKVTTSSKTTTTTSIPAVSDPAFKKKDGGVNYRKVDIDLTGMTSTMIYSEVLDMSQSPDKNLGKTVRMNGAFAVLEETERNYYACVIADATACCSKGIEFMLNNEYLSYPDEYPKVNTNITVSGVFDRYYEGENQYIQLINAVIE